MNYKQIGTLALLCVYIGNANARGSSGAALGGGLVGGYILGRATSGGSYRSPEIAEIKAEEREERATRKSIQRELKTLRKDKRELNKRFEKETDPETRVIIREDLANVNRQIESLQRDLTS